MSANQANISKARLWTGRILTGWVGAFLLFDGVVKLLTLEMATEATVRLGIPATQVFTIGVIELTCLLLYLVPRTAPIGALLLTAYLGGATAIQLRIEDPWFLFPAVIGVWIWAGLLLRDRRLALVLLRNEIQNSELGIRKEISKPAAWRRATASFPNS